MEQQKFLELLQSIQIPDTERVKAATTELRKTFYPHPQSLIWLLHILTSHEDPALRQQAAVEALRLTNKHWVALPAEQKPAIRQQLLQSTLDEPKPLVRHSAARVIAAIAKVDLDDGEWADLPNSLLQASTSPQASYREVGVYILFTLLDTAGDEFESKLPGLFELFATTIVDPESAEVRINTLLALSRVAMLIEPEEDPDNLARFVQAFPSMVAVLKATVESGDEERAMQAFEVFQVLLGCESALLGPHFKDLVTFMLEISANKSIEAESRSQGLSFLMQCVRYRKMKIQGLKGMGEALTLKCLEIATEIEDDDDEDDDDVTPYRSALGLLDLLASSLPPRQVIVPLLKVLPDYVNSENPKFRQAAILGLGMCVEGAPDFVATQLDTLMPIVLGLLNDPVVAVRNASLHGVARLADELAEDLCKYHEQLLPALLKNLDSASAADASISPAKALNILKASCSALDSVTEGMEKDVMVAYLPELIPRLGNLLSHSEFSVKESAAGAMGPIAGAAMEAFLPYFEDTMKALSQFVTIKDSDEELDLRGTVCDTMGRIAAAVGAEAFEPYVQPLMAASEEGLHLDNPRLKETSYILWSTLAKVYSEKFTVFLPGVFKGLMDSLEQEESDLEVELGEAAKDLLGTEVVIAGKKVKVASATDEIDDLDEMGGDDDDDDWDDLTAVTAVALEKEIALEVLGDVLSHTRNDFVPYFEKTVETIVPFVEHSYEGVRKAAICTLWRAYACLWTLMEDHTGVKWSPGLPLKSQPSGELLKLGEVVATATLTLWEDETDRAVVTDINRNVAATLRLCGPAILTQEKFAERTTSVLTLIITKSHPCQQDLGDLDGGDDIEEEESSEYDWLVIDTALDVVIGLSKAVGEQFSELWKIYQKPIMKFASSQTNFERSTAIGVIAECTVNMAQAVTPYTSVLLKLLLHRLTDEDPETKSNAAYAIGLLVFHSTDSATYLPSYPAILQKLEPLLRTEHARTIDNACGCVTRMIMAHQDHVPMNEILPILVDLLPLKDDYEENHPIFACIAGLYQQGNETILNLTPKMLPVFASVLSPPAEQLEDDTREKVVQTVKFIASKDSSLISGNEVLMAAASS